MRETRPQRPLYARAITAVVLVALTAAVIWPASVLAATTKGKGEDTPLDLGTDTTTTSSGTGGVGGASVVRAIVGLAIVVGLIFLVRWALRKIQENKIGRAAGEGMYPIASLPLGPRGTLHLVRVGEDVILLGQAEGQLTALRTYEREEAERLGMLHVAEDVIDADGDSIGSELGWSRPGAPAVRNGAARRNGQRAPRNGAAPTAPTVGAMLDSLRARTVRR